MDIAKYIGLFLLKNHFCYVHGLGNIELKKRAAIHDGTALQAPSYEVVVTPGGSIDDNLANFIATNEQISISKAANELREFSIQTRKDIADGKEVAIPGIGKFTEESGKIKFTTDANFKYTPAGIPIIKNSKQLEEQNARPVHKPSYPPPHKADSINWSMVILAIVLVILIAGGAYGIYYYTSHSNSDTTTTTTFVKDTVVPVKQPAIDTTQPHTDTVAMAGTPPAASDTLLVRPYKWVIGNYKSKDKADKRMKNINMAGVEVAQKDSSNFFVLVTINSRMNDTLHVKDSLKRYFGYGNVVIYK